MDPRELQALQESLRESAPSGKSNNRKKTKDKQRRYQDSQ